MTALQAGGRRSPEVHHSPDRSASGGLLAPQNRRFARAVWAGVAAVAAAWLVVLVLVARWAL